MSTTLVRTRSCLTAGFCLALLLGTGGVAIAQEKPAETPSRGAPAGGAPGRGAPARGESGDAASVEAAMKGMGRALRGLGKTVADPAMRDQSLAAISDMQRNCVLAKGMPLPAHVHKEVTDAAERAKLAVAYRSDLIKVLQGLLAVEQSVLEGKGEQAKKQLDAVLSMRDAGHKAMGVED